MEGERKVGQTLRNITDYDRDGMRGSGLSVHWF